MEEEDIVADGWKAESWIVFIFYTERLYVAGLKSTPR